jgi:transglutaminase/protease-like cytokinesis protein 3
MKKALFICLLLLNGMAWAQRSDFKHVDFRQADSVAKAHKGVSLKNLPILAYKLTKPLKSEVEKFRAIYTWVSTNITLDYLAFAKNKNKRRKLRKDSVALDQWKRSFRTKSYRKLLRSKTTVCTGYAYLVKELATMADINCKIIHGYGRTPSSNVGILDMPNHSWNVVKLNNRCYLCDATWSSGEFDVQKNTFLPDYNDGYFLAEPALFVKNHYPIDTRWILMENKPTMEEFLNAPVVYKHAFGHGICPIEPKIMHIKLNKGDMFTLVLKVDKNTQLDKLKLEIITGENSDLVKPKLVKLNNGLIKLTHPFRRTGYYDVHLKLGNHYILTHTVKVVRKKK